MLKEIPIATIYRGERARPLDDGNVQRLASSIKSIGLINPIMVRPARRIHGGIMRDVYEIVAGCHRYEAASSLGWETISCKVVEDMDDLKIELAEIDENLIRANLSKAQEAIAVNRRKQIYEAMHPETAHGGDHGNQYTGGKSQQLRLAERFTEATAKATGKSERTVQLAAQIGKKLAADLPEIAGTSLDNIRDLQAMAQMKPEERADLIARAKAGEKVKARKEPKSEIGYITEVRPRKIAADPLGDMEACEAQVARLMSAWNAAGPDARQEFLARIDAPIMDQRFG